MRFYIGTSGWNYFWNEGQNLLWYVKNTPFNAVELNASFYRFPYPNQVKSWAKVGSSLKWSVKVNQAITHRYKLSEKALGIFEKFRNLFTPMEEKGLIDFYLFQMPPMFRPTDRNIEKVRMFANETALGEKFAIEFRHTNWFEERWVSWAQRLGITFVSVDAPEFVAKVYKSCSKIYLRLHGRAAWYHHIYTKEELLELINKIMKYDNTDSVYIFLNNNHGMLPAGELLIAILRELDLTYRKI